MRASKLLGVLFLVSSLFVFTRGAGWHLATLAGGGFLGLLGLLLVSRRKVHRLRVRKPQWSRPLPHAGRARFAVASASKRDIA